MTKVFIGGSRRVTRLDAAVEQRLDRIIEKRLAIVVGDANGADKAVQVYLRSKAYNLVEVFCSGDSCRNNVGAWPVRKVPVPKNSKRKDFSFYATKDRAMADEATVGFMVWDRKSVGTLMNVLRLVQQHKKAVVYIAPDKEFANVEAESGWERFLARCADDLKQCIEKEWVVERGDKRDSLQASLF